ncbi:inositol 1,4,5-trisphosphate receptor-interacting protein-like [Polypterus senegalus]
MGQSVSSEQEKASWHGSKVRMISCIKDDNGKTVDLKSEHPIRDRQDVEVLILDHFYKAFVDVNSLELQVAQEIVEPIVGIFHKFMKDHEEPNQPRIIGDAPLKSGSVEEQLKVLHPDEFDFMFPIALPSGMGQSFKFCHSEPDLPQTSFGFGMIQIQDKGNERFVSKFVENQYLLPDKLKDWFKSKTQKAMEFVEKNKKDIFRSINVKNLVQINPGDIIIKMAEIGAGVCLTIKYDIGINTVHQIPGKEKNIFSYSVDLIPAIQVEASDIYLIPKSFKSELHHNSKVKKTYLWRLSFSLYEMSLIRFLGQRMQLSCHTKCLKILKALRDLDTKNNPSSQLSSVLTSYHLKTMLLHIMVKDKFSVEKWKGSLLVDRIKELLEFMQKATKERRLENVLFSYELNSIPFDGKPLQKHLKIPDWAIAKKQPQAINLFSENFIDHNSLDQVRARVKEIQEQWLNVIHKHVAPLYLEITP